MSAQPESADFLGAAPPAVDDAQAVWVRKDAATGELPRVRYAEMQAIKDGLQDLDRFPMATLLAAVGTLVGGAVLGGIYGALAADKVSRDYKWSLVVGGVVAVMAFIGAASTRDAHVKSVKSIRRDFNRFMESFKYVGDGEGPGS